MNDVDSLQQIIDFTVSHRLMDASKPSFFLLVFCANAAWYLPIVMLVSPQWRRVMDKFMHGDDGKYEKEDRRDAAVDIVAFYLFAIAVHIASYDLIYKERHYEYVGTFLGTGLIMWGFKGIIARTTKHNTHETGR